MLKLLFKEICWVEGFGVVGFWGWKLRGVEDIVMFIVFEGGEERDVDNVECFEGVIEELFVDVDCFIWLEFVLEDINFVKLF